MSIRHFLARHFAARHFKGLYSGVAPVACLANDVISASSVGASGIESLLVSYTPGADRNDFTGEVGVRLGIGTSNITVESVGVRCNTGNTGLRTVKIYEWFSGSVVATATVDLTGKAPGDYAWGAIAPLTLLANGYYAVLMVVTAFDGQQWSNNGPVTFGPQIVNVYDSYYLGGLATGLPNSSFVGLDLGWGAATALPAVHQVHILAANDVISVSSVTRPMVGVVGGILANDVKSNSSVSQPSAVIRRDVLANDVKSNSSVSQPVAVIGRTLLANDVKSNSSVTQPVAAIQRAILANDVVSPSKVGNPIVGIVGTIDARDLVSQSSTGAAEDWTPTAIPTGMFGWWDAADAATLTFSGSNLTQWNDKSGNARHVSRMAASGPTLDSINGVPALNFVSGQGLMTAGTTTFGDFTLFGVFEAAAFGPTYERIADHVYTDGWWFGRTGSSQTWGGGVVEGVPPYGVMVPLPDGEPHQISSMREGSAHTVRGNGGASSSNNTVTTATTASNKVYIADDNFGTAPLANGAIGEILIWSRALTADEMAKVEGYLAWKWGIQAKLPVGHAYKSAAPTQSTLPALHQNHDFTNTTLGSDESLYPATAAATGEAPSVLSLGSRIGILSNGHITGIRWWMDAAMLPSRTVAIWSDAGVLLFSALSTTGVPGWNIEPVSPPLAVSASDVIRVAYGYAGSGSDGDFGFTNSPVYADTANLDFISGCYYAGGSSNFPATVPADSNYYADIVYQAGVAAFETVVSASSVTQPTASIQRSVLANDVLSPSSVTRPVVVATSIILANDVLSASRVTTPTVHVSVEQALLANDVTSPSSVSQPALVEISSAPPIPVPVPPAHGGLPGGGAGYIGAEQKKRLSELVERAYRKALKIEPEVAEAIRAAIPSASQRKSAQVSARRLKTIDFERLTADVDRVRELLERIEQIAQATKIQAAMDALIAYEIALEEDDMEVLLLAA